MVRLQTPPSPTRSPPRTGKRKFGLKLGKMGKKYTNSGLLVVESCCVVDKSSFLHYIRGGFELAFSVAVDFTASNGKPTLSQSLHYINPYQPNQYMQVLRSVGNIIQCYDSDHYFPAFGFGAKLPDGSISHNFPLNANPANPYCQVMLRFGV